MLVNHRLNGCITKSSSSKSSSDSGNHSRWTVDACWVGESCRQFASGQLFVNHYRVTCISSVHGDENQTCSVCDRHLREVFCSLESDRDVCSTYPICAQGCE